MQHKFFASKLNTVLLLILIISTVFAIRFMLQNKETYLSMVDQKNNQGEIKSDTYTYTTEGVSIELPKGYIPEKFDETDGSDAGYFLFKGVYLDYSSRASWWEKNKLTEYKYIKDQKIGETVFKIYSWDNGTHYWFRNGENGYDFLATDEGKSKFEELLKTFKFIGWSKENNISWINSPKDFDAVVSYPSNWQITPQRYASPASQVYGKDYLVGYTFTLPSGTMVILGGAQGGCSPTEFGEFKYGVSTLTCLKGYRTSIGMSSAREVVSQSDLKLLGDFIVRNK